MAIDYKKNYYQAISMLEFLEEGHSIPEAATEFDVSRDTVRRRIRNLCSSASVDRNVLLYRRTHKVLTSLKLL